MEVVEFFKKIKSDIQLWRDEVRRKIGILLYDNKKKMGGDKSNQLVIVRWDAKLGDAIVSSWFLREVKRNNPSICITVITTKNMSSLFENFFFADKIISIEKRPSYAKLKTIANDLSHVDYLIHLGKKLKMKDIYFISKVDASYVIGLDDELECIDIKLGGVTDGIHFSDKFLFILKAMNIKPLCRDYVIPYINEDEIAVRSQWPNDKNDKLVACFNPYGSGNARQLSRDNIVKICLVLSEEFDFKTCILFPPDKMDEVKSIIENIKADVFIYPDVPTVGCMISQIRHCDLLVSVDTATIHVATGLNKPILGIYNSDMKNYKEWGPNSNNAKVIFSDDKVNASVNDFDISALRSSLAEIKNVIG